MTTTSHYGYTEQDWDGRIKAGCTCGWEVDAENQELGDKALAAHYLEVRDEET